MNRLLISSLIIILSSQAHAAREDFGGWIDEDGDCQDTRQEILFRDKHARVHWMSDNGCKIKWSVWYTPYAKQTIYDPSKLDIDHIVPLNHAWENGAKLWSKEQRIAFANDPENLLAVSASENRSKGDRGPDKWMPKDFGYWCEYIQKWTYVKDKYGLSYSEPEIAVINVVNKTCLR